MNKNGSYIGTVLNSEQMKTNLMSLDQKLREELSVGGFSNFFEGVGGGEWRGFHINVLTKKFFIFIV